MKKIIILLIILVIPIHSIAKNFTLKSYHFEYGSGLMNIYSFPKYYERCDIVHPPALDEYMIGVELPIEDSCITPIIGISETSYDFDREAGSEYIISCGVVVERDNIKFKITNKGFSLGITF